MSDGRMSTEPYDYPYDAYPSRHPKGTGGWQSDEAWGILDRIKPGVIPNDVRAYLAGLIAGTLARVAKEGPRR